MTEQCMFEVVVDTIDETTVRELETGLSGLNPQRTPPTRELITVLTIASTVLTIVKTLLEIREKLKAKGSTQPVRIRNIERDELELLSATDEAIEQFVRDAPQP